MNIDFHSSQSEFKSKALVSRRTYSSRICEAISQKAKHMFAESPSSTLFPWHSVKISGFFYHSDFKSNQFLGILEPLRFAAGFALLEYPKLISHKFWVIGKIWKFHTVPSINILCWSFLSDLSTLRREWEESFHLLVWPFLPFWHERSMRFCVITNSFL